MLFVPSDCVKFPCWCCTKLPWCICIQCIHEAAYWSEGVWGWKKDTRDLAAAPEHRSSQHIMNKNTATASKKSLETGSGETMHNWSLVSLERKHIDWSWSNWFCSGRSRTIGSGFFWEWADVSSRLNTARGGGLVPPMSSVRMYSSTSRALWVPPL